MKFRILKKKLLFLHHLSTLPDESLAREIFEIQKIFEFPGLVQECRETLLKMGTTDITKFSKSQWKKIVNSYISGENERELLDIMKSYKKINPAELASESCSAKSYLSEMYISRARLKFKLRASMTPTVKMNFMNDALFKRQMWICDGCAKLSCDTNSNGKLDTQQHILVCEGYKDLREGKDLDKDQDLVGYFEAVIRRRMLSDT